MKKIAVLVGSQRKHAFSAAIAKNLIALAPDTLELEIIPVHHLPFFNQDWEEDLPTPEDVEAFRHIIGGADGVVFVTPEYNRSVPAPLKNAVDIASRPPGSNKWSRKPVLIVSTSPGGIGGFGAYHVLLQSLGTLNASVMLYPEIYLGRVHEALDEEGKLKDESTKKFLTNAMKRFSDWVEKNA